MKRLLTVVLVMIGIFTLTACNKPENPKIDEEIIEVVAREVSANAKACMTEDSVCVVVLTDTHYKTGDAMLATHVAKRLAELTDAAAIVHLGDLADGVTEGKSAMTALWEQHSAILRDSDVPYLQVVGNHDDGNLYNRRQGDRAAENYAASWELFRATTANNQNDIVCGSENGWYCLDDPVSRTRFIVLNSHDYPWQTDDNGCLVYDSSVQNVENGIKSVYSADQLSWLGSEALCFPDDDWTAVVCAHRVLGNWSALNYILTNAAKGKHVTEIPQNGVFDDIYGIYNYSNVQVKANGYLPKKTLFWSGDIHMDTVNNDKVYPMVTFLNASHAKNQENIAGKTVDTPNETAVSVVVLDNKTGTMHDFRFGVGEDREISY